MRFLRWLRCHVLSLHRDDSWYYEVTNDYTDDVVIWRWCADCGVQQ